MAEPITAEHARREDPAWRRWGPYLSERAWGTVREDYSADGDAWSSFPHDQARSRAYRWSEDGLGGICDEDQHLCLAFAFWNGVDPILKERIFGLTGDQGNHGEDAKELWWYLDSTPSHSWMRWRYVYPQAAFPYEDLRATNAARDRTQPEYELLDTGIFAEDRYWEVTVDYAKGAPEDLCLRVSVTNRGPDAAVLHLLPTLWFRNRWSWDPDVARPRITATSGGGLMAADAGRPTMVLTHAGPAATAAPRSLFCDNETNRRRIFPDSPTAVPYPKDGIADHVLSGGTSPTVNPQLTGTKAALWYTLAVPAGVTQEVHLRLRDTSTLAADRPELATVLAQREQEADAFYATLAPGADPDEQRILRQALAGMLWSKQFYHLDVARWLDGDPGQPVPPAQRLTGRNHGWRHLSNRDIISMPDTWEYPWYAAWDLAFHAIALAHVDPGFAKGQLRLIMREWYMHPAGKLPAYEWNFDDVNPPVHAIATLAVFEIDGGRDREWLVRMFHKLLLSFTWWANVKDPEGNNLFGGGFLGMDNVGPFDRSAPLPDGLTLEQADGTGWMALYCLSMLEIALVLARQDRAYEDVAVKFFEHFVLIAEAINAHGLWDEADGFYYDRVRRPADGEAWPVRVRSMTGLIPLCAVAAADSVDTAHLHEFNRRVADYLQRHPEARAFVRPAEDGKSMLMALVGHDRLPRVIERIADPAEFLSPHGLRALSAAYRGRPFEFWIGGEMTASVDYEPAESTTPLFGGNSNWRGPIWFPVNHLVVGALGRYASRLGPATFEYPRGSGRRCTLEEIRADLQDRLIAIFRRDADGQRPVLASYPGMPAAWADNVPFHEYFHGDTGAGLGACHQTGWTGLVADLIISAHRAG
ncbi:MAG TPA: hypothetical protein VFN48_01815 [Solirubrobacteraceae bacterium]|nr:hypothetical protein [Solirubrobacteraceae bacterium]